MQKIALMEKVAFPAIAPFVFMESKRESGLRLGRKGGHMAGAAFGLLVWQFERFLRCGSDKEMATATVDRLMRRHRTTFHPLTGGLCDPHHGEDYRAAHDQPSKDTSN